MFRKYGYGVTLTSEREIEFLRIQLISLRKLINLDKLDIVINTSLDPKLIPFNVNRIICQERFKMGKYCSSEGAIAAGHDVANRLDMIIREAKQEWVILTHSDMVWTGNVIKVIYDLEKIDKNIGIIGAHSFGVTIVRKEFYELSPFGFYPLSSLSIIRESNNFLRIIAPVNPFGEVTHPLHYKTLGLDVGELLALDCWNKGYKHVLFPNPPNVYKHAGEQSLYMLTKELDAETQKQKLDDLDKRREIWFKDRWRP